MKAAIFYEPEVIKLEDREIRDLESSELLVKVSYAGICGTDLHILDGSADSSPPVILGHEYAGIVEDTGSDVRGFKKGDFVSVDPNITCGECYYCRRGMIHFCENFTALGVNLDGGFAEYSIVPESQVYRLNGKVPMEWASMVEPVSCCLHGIDIADIDTGETVVIMGAGAIGLIMIQLSRMSGAGKIIVVEPLDERIKVARQTGADIVINPLKVDMRNIIKKNTYDGGDVIIECAGIPELYELSFDIMRRGGRLICFGVSNRDAEINVKPQKIYHDELTIKGSFVNPGTFRRAIILLEDGKLDFSRFTFKKFRLEELLSAFDNHREHRSIKTLISFGENEE